MIYRSKADYFGRDELIDSEHVLLSRMNNVGIVRWQADIFGTETNGFTEQGEADRSKKADKRSSLPIASKNKQERSAIDKNQADFWQKLAERKRTS